MLVSCLGTLRMDIKYCTHVWGIEPGIGRRFKGSHRELIAKADYFQNEAYNIIVSVNGNGFFSYTGTYWSRVQERTYWCHVLL